jgi:hypothetical protein
MDPLSHSVAPKLVGFIVCFFVGIDIGVGGEPISESSFFIHEFIKECESFLGVIVKGGLVGKVKVESWSSVSVCCNRLAWQKDPPAKVSRQPEKA